MRLLIRDPIPSFWELGVRGTDILISVHEKAMSLLEEGIGNSFVDMKSEELKIPEFIRPNEDGWGFGRVLFPIESEKTGWISWRCSLPAILTPDLYEERNWTEAFAVSATLEVLCSELSFMELKIETGSLYPQLLLVQAKTFERERFPTSVSISAVISPSLIQWFLKKKDGFNLIEVVEAMKEAHKHLFPRLHNDNLDFRARIHHPKGINLTCPGDACGLDPEDNIGESLDRGYRLVPHNVTGPIQQLTFFAGLAALDQLAREDIS